MLQNQLIKIGISPKLGIRGVLANKNIAKGKIIEVCPTIIYPTSYEDLIEKTPLKKYIFYWTKKNDCVVLGWGSLYNHSYNPNAYYTHNYKGKTITIHALNDIKKGEEITVNYNGEPNSKEKIEDYYFTFDKEE